MPEEKYVEVDGQKFVDDGTGNPKLDDDGQSIPFVEEEKTVPYSRFKEVNEQKKTAEQERDSLKKTTEPQLTPEQQKEKQAKDYLRGITKEVLAEEKKAVKEEEVQEQKKFEDEVSDILAVNTDIDKDEFLKFIEDNGDKYGITSVKGAMTLYKDMGKAKTDTEEKTKEDLAKKPNLPKTEGAKPEKSVDDSEKTFQQVVDEELREAETKGQK